MWTLFQLCLALLFLRILRTFLFLLMIVLDNQKDPFFNSIISAINYIFHFPQIPGLKICRCFTGLGWREITENLVTGRGTQWLIYEWRHNMHHKASAFKINNRWGQDCMPYKADVIHLFCTTLHFSYQPPSCVWNDFFQIPSSCTYS